MARRHLFVVPSLIALLTQTACLQSVLTPAHRLDEGELVLAGAAEVSLTPRLSGSATYGFGFADATAYATMGSFGLTSDGGLLLGGGIAGRVYTPAPIAIAGSLEYARAVAGSPLENGDTFQLGQGMLKVVTIPEDDFPVYGGLTVNAPLTAFDGSLLTENRLTFFGFLVGLDSEVNDGFHFQLEFMLRPLVLQNGPDGNRFGLLTEDLGGDAAFAALLTGGQLNIGVNFRVASF